MEKSNRPQRNRRHSRRAWPPEDDLHYPRPAKRLFTPEIKRMLKEWLVRRRENPYPSRDEKKRLAIETGLTYTQICNWFANWRRKLKNSEREKSKKSWGHLIKHYNTNAKGNVEQFSISSEDSIWEEEQQYRRRQMMNEMNHFRINDDDDDDDDDDEEDSSICDIEGSNESTDMERNGSCGSAETQMMDIKYKPNYYLDTMKKEAGDLFIGREIDVITTTATCQISGNSNGCGGGGGGITKTKYKQKMMEKYLRDTYDKPEMKNHLMQSYPTQTVFGNNNNTTTTIIKSGAELSKWLESAAKFTPNKNNYYIEWNNKRNNLDRKSMKTFLPPPTSIGLQSPNTTVTMLPLLYTTSTTSPIVQTDNSNSKQHIYDAIHHKDELDAAEALANLAFNCRQKMLDSSPTVRCTSFARPLNAISS